MKDFEKLFQEYSVETDETIINDEIEKILTQTPLNHNINTILYGCLDYTSLNCTDNEDHINKMVEHINNNIKTDVAAICVYPYFVNTVKTNLRKNGVNIAAVSGGFPSSQTFQEIKIAENAMNILDCKVIEVEDYYIEEINAERHVVIIRKNSKIPAKYPRVQNKPRTQPL